MIKTLLFFEVKKMVGSSKIIWSILIFVALFSVIVFLRTNEFSKQLQTHIEDMNSIEESNHSAVNYSYLSIGAVKPPQLFSIFHNSYSDKRGRVISVRPFFKISGTTILSSSWHSFFPLSLDMDVTFLVTFFLSLFILMMSFDAVNKEKEDGTLRLLFSYPVKRSVFLVSKVLSVFLLSMLVFAIPFILSLFVLFTIFPETLSSGLLAQILLYFIITKLFIFLMSMIGVLISVLTRHSARSLIYALSLWVILVFILPQLYLLVSKPLTSPDKISSLQSQLDSLIFERTIHVEKLPEEKDPIKVGHYIWNGQSYHSQLHVFGHYSMMMVHKKYMNYYYENIYPLIIQEESIHDEIRRLSHNNLNYKPYFLFFNPMVVYESIVENISANSINDYLDHIYAARSLRNDFMSQGLSDGWLLGFDYFSLFSGDDYFLDYNDWLVEELGYDHGLNENEDQYWEYVSEYMDYMSKMYNNLRDTYEFSVPFLPSYSYKIPPIMDLISLNIVFLLIWGVFIGLLFILLTNKFLKYDLR